MMTTWTQAEQLSFQGLLNYLHLFQIKQEWELHLHWHHRILTPTAPNTTHTNTNIFVIFFLSFYSVSFFSANMYLFALCLFLQTVSPWWKPRSFFKCVVDQLLVATEQAAMELAAGEDANGLDASNSVFLFVGEVISRVSRRGSTGEYSSFRM